MVEGCKYSAGGFFSQKKGFTGPFTILTAVKLQRSLPKALCTVYEQLYM
jgi:hypothetical protein